MSDSPLLPMQKRNWRLLDVFTIIFLAMFIVPVIYIWLVKLSYQMRGLEFTLEQLQEGTLLPALILQELTLLWLTITSVRRGYGQPVKMIGVNQVPIIKTLVSGLLWGAALIWAQIMAEQISYLVFSNLLGEEKFATVLAEETQQVVSLFALGQGPVAVGVLFFLFVVIVPLAEEIFFRGFAFQVFKERYGGQGAVFASALLFSLVHGYVVEFLPIFVVGIGLGYIVKHFQSIWPGVIGHALINLVSVVAGLFFH